MANSSGQGNTIILTVASEVSCRRLEVPPATILAIAEEYFLGKGFEYFDGSPGYIDKDGTLEKVDLNNNGVPDVNCLGLVEWALKMAGCGVKLFSVLPQFGNGRVNSRYFEQIPFRSAGPGDIFYVKASTPTKTGAEWWKFYSGGVEYKYDWHVGIIAQEETAYNESNTVFHAIKLWRGPVYDLMKVQPQRDMQSATDDNSIGAKVSFRIPDFYTGSGEPDYRLVGVYRPKFKCDPHCYKELKKQEEFKRRRSDPLILDLAGNGIHTYGLDAGIHFDHDNNGFMELSGWVGPGSGLLMIDKNGNYLLDGGNELFGDSTVLPNGTRAANGFEALAYYDSNHDGRIDASDPIWNQLRVWQDNSDSIMYSADPAAPANMKRLDQLGIVAIHLQAEVVNATGTDGNTEFRSGHFEWNSGAIGTIAEYQLVRDTGHSVAVAELEVSPEIAAMPNLYGTGNVYDLQQAMVRDSSGQLKQLVAAFAAQARPADRAHILDQIICRWTGADSFAADCRGPFMDGRKVVALERFFADPSQNPDAELAVSWQATYWQMSEFFYADLMAQTHLKGLFDKIAYTWDDGSQVYRADMSAVIADLRASLTNDPEQEKQLLSEFARSLRGLKGQDRVECLPCREQFITQDPSLAWVIDTGGLPVIDHLGQGDGWYYWHMFGTDGSDAVMGSLTEGDGFINGLEGDDVIYGTDRNEMIYSGSGDSLLYGGGGNDQLYAGEGNDILDRS